MPNVCLVNLKLKPEVQATYIDLQCIPYLGAWYLNVWGPCTQLGPKIIFFLKFTHIFVIICQKYLKTDKAGYICHDIIHCGYVN